VSVVRPLRRRKRRSLVVLARVYALFLVLVVVLLGAAAYAFVTSPSLRAKHVSVAPTAHVTATEIRAAAAIDPETNVWLLNTGAVARRIERIPYVDRAAVVRAFPATVRLDVSERRDWACVAAGSARAAVDTSARVLHAGCSPSLPLLRSPHSVLRAGSSISDRVGQQLMRDQARLAATIAPHVLGFDRFGSLEGALTSGVVVRFGSDRDLEAKAALVGPILDTAGAHAHRVRSVDLRAPATPVVGY